MINFDEPNDPSSYFHRIGRTARFGRYGASFLFLTPERSKLFLQSRDFVFKIQELKGVEDLHAHVENINQLISKNVELLEKKDPDANPFERTKLQERVYLGGDSIIGTHWTDKQVQNFNEENFKYFDPNAAEMMIEPVEGEEEELLDSQEEEGDQVDEKMSDAHSPRIQVQISIQEVDGNTALPSISPVNHMLEENLRSEPSILISGQKQGGRRSDLMLGKREPLQADPSQHSLLTFEEFSELCDLLQQQPRLVRVLRLFQKHTGTDIQTLRLHQQLLTHSIH